MSRRLTVIISVLAVVVIVLGVALYALSRRGGVTTSSDLESEVSRETPAALPSGTVTGIGSGGTATGTWYELHFTAPVYPDNPANHRDGLDTHLVALMDKATKTLD